MVVTPAVSAKVDILEKVIQLNRSFYRSSKCVSHGHERFPLATIMKKGIEMNGVGEDTMMALGIVVLIAMVRAIIMIVTVMVR